MNVTGHVSMTCIFTFSSIVLNISFHRVAVVNKLTDFIILLGKLTVSLLVGVGSFFFFTEKIPFVNDYVAVPAVTYHWTPIAVRSLYIFKQ